MSQEIQNKESLLPYHWFIKPYTYKGREYHGCLNVMLKYMPSYTKALDIGCGDGFFTSKLKGRVHGLDYSEHAIAFAKILAPRVNFTIGDATKLPYKDDSFDLVIFNGVLEHIEPSSLPETIKEATRVLMGRGYILVSVPSDGIPVIDKHYQHFTPNALNALFQRDYTLVNIIGVGTTSFWNKRLFSNYRFNMYVYPKYFNEISFENGYKKVRQLVAIYKKTNL